MSLDAETMSALKFGNYALGLAYPSANPQSSQRVSDFIEKLEDLLAECLDSDLTPDIKKLFIRHLEAIRTSLLDYRAGGSSDLEAVLDQAIGAMHRHVEPIKNQPEGALNIAGKVFDAIASANELITFGQNALLLSGPVAATFLPLLQH